MQDWIAAGLDRGAGSIDRANILKSLLKHMLRCIVYQNILAIEPRLRLLVRDSTANLYDEVITSVNHLMFFYYMRRLTMKVTSCTLGSGQNGQLILTIGIKVKLGNKAVSEPVWRTKRHLWMHEY